MQVQQEKFPLRQALLVLGLIEFVDCCFLVGFNKKKHSYMSGVVECWNGYEARTHTRVRKRNNHEMFPFFPSLWGFFYPAYIDAVDMCA